jgi:methyltransferase (TIGR00027 family)
MTSANPKTTSHASQSDPANLVRAGVLRYVQNTYERRPWRNPDSQVRRLLDADTRREADRYVSRHGIGRLRMKDFYNYLLLRTLWYDEVFKRSVADGAGQIVIIGAGTDTRAYRFRNVLLRKQVRVIECDVPEAIRAKQRGARNLEAANVRYAGLDLHSTRPSTWAVSCGYSRSTKTLFLIEGVTPYVREHAFRKWLGFLARTTCQGSLFACDYKIPGTDDDFGRIRGRRTMRMSRSRDRVHAFHNALGLDVVAVMGSRELTRRYLNGTAERRPVFDEDFIVIATKR